MSIRLWATASIWLAFTIILGIIAAALTSSNANLDFGGSLVVLAIIFVLARTVQVSTQAIWQSAHEDDWNDRRRGKTKRQTSNRIERLIDALEDDEVYELEALLLAREQADPAHRLMR